jgi:hypothetical protein
MVENLIFGHMEVGNLRLGKLRVGRSAIYSNLAVNLAIRIFVDFSANYICENTPDICLESNAIKFVSFKNAVFCARLLFSAKDILVGKNDKN